MMTNDINLKVIDINADLGEGCGDDAAMLGLISSANIACGGHAGSPALMRQTMQNAKANHVAVGFHPGFADAEHFGRRRLDLPPALLTTMLEDQLDAWLAAAKDCDLQPQHFKLHGALANMAAEDRNLAEHCFHIALAKQPNLILLTIAGTAQIEAAQKLGALYANEIYADRGYDNKGQLLPRHQAGAVLHDETIIKERILAMLRHQAIISHQNVHVATKIDSICVHGDNTQSVKITQSLRQALLQEGFQLRPLGSLAC